MSKIKVLNRDKLNYGNVVIGSFGKRLKAFIIDFLLLLFLGFFVNATLDPIYNNSSLGKQQANAQKTLNLESHLFIDSSNGLLHFEYDLDKAIFSEEELLGHVAYFYNEAESSKFNQRIFDYESSSFFVAHTDFNFYEMVLGKDNFTFASSEGLTTYSFKSDLTSSEKNAEWTRVYDKALSVFKSSNVNKKITQPITFAFYALLMASIAISGLIVFIAVPLFLKHGRTIGKAVSGLIVVNRDGYFATNKMIIFRNLFLILVELCLSLPLFSIPLLITTGSLSVSKKKAALHDVLFKTIVVDVTVSKIFANKNDERTYFDVNTSQEDKDKVNFLKLDNKG